MLVRSDKERTKRRSVPKRQVEAWDPNKTKQIAFAALLELEALNNLQVYLVLLHEYYRTRIQYHCPILTAGSCVHEFLTAEQPQSQGRNVIVVPTHESTKRFDMAVPRGIVGIEENALRLPSIAIPSAYVYQPFGRAFIFWR